MMIGIAAVPDSATPLPVAVTTGIAGDWSKLFAAALGTPPAALEATDPKVAPIADPASAAATEWLDAATKPTPAVAAAPVAIVPEASLGLPPPAPVVPLELAVDRPATDVTAAPVRVSKAVSDVEVDGRAEDAEPMLARASEAAPILVPAVLLTLPMQHAVSAGSAADAPATSLIPASVATAPQPIANVPANSTTMLLPMVSAAPRAALSPAVNGNGARLLRRAEAGEAAPRADDVQPLAVSRRDVSAAAPPMIPPDAPIAKIDTAAAAIRSVAPVTAEPPGTLPPDPAEPAPELGIGTGSHKLRVDTPVSNVTTQATAHGLRAPVAVPAAKHDAIAASADVQSTRRRSVALAVETVTATPADRPAPAPALLVPLAAAPLPLLPANDAGAAPTPALLPVTPATAGDGALDVATANLGSIGVIVDAVETRLAVRLSVEPGPAALLLAAAGDRLDASLSAVGQRLDTLTVDIRDGDTRRPPPPPYTSPPPSLRRPTTPPRAARDRYA